jgi:hypothetical protein
MLSASDNNNYSIEVMAVSGIKYNKIEYKDFGESIQLDNGLIEVVVTLEIGPRVMRFGALNGKNMFCDDAPLTIDKGDEEWRLRGGHRLWHSPEAFPRTYDADNYPVEWSKVPQGVRVKRRLEPVVQVEKEMIITLTPEEKKATVEHILTNRNAWPIELSAWGLSVMAAGGKAVIPIPQNVTHFSEGNKGARTLTLWSYTKMNDPRVYWGDKYVMLKQDRTIESPIKFGMSNEDGWAAYINDGNAFIKRFNHEKGAKYPDHGASIETFAIDFMLELESLSPLVLLDPGDEVRHIEEWELVENVDELPENEEELVNWVYKYDISRKS